ncbi:ROK family transcriptional regulator [Roseibium sp. SCP14]|uniref:ROK family transcriptional regulator n=1 Tax=Roseibium sp. SCP14 TaxID=3141375 RepID=UPI00333B8BEB
MYDPTRGISERFFRSPTLDQVASPNERALLRVIRETQGISRAELSERSDLTQQSVYRLIEAMRERGLVVLGDPKPVTGRGQPSPTIWLNPGYAFTAGVSLNTDAIGTCIFDFAGQIRAMDRIDNFETPRSVGLERIKSSIDSQIGALNLRKSRMLGFGFAIAGYKHEGTTYNTPQPLHEWSLIELGPLISEYFSRPVWTANTANTAAICEQMLGVGKFFSDFAYLSFDYGFGGAAIVGGALLQGGHGNAGELSVIYKDDELDKRPALEFLVRTLQRHGMNIPSVEYIRLNYDPDWPGVEDWISGVMPSLNRVINAIYAVLDPQVIVFGGQIPKVLAHQLISRTEISNRTRHGRQMKAPNLVVPELDLDASAVGAAAMPFKDVFF